MGAQSGGASVVLTQGAGADPTTIRDVIMQVVGANRIDAMQAARRGVEEGVVARSVGLGAAKAMAAALNAKGVAARALPDDKTPPRPRPEQVRKVDCRSKGLVALDMHGEEAATLSWDRLTLISVGVIRQPKTAKRVQDSGDAAYVGGGVHGTYHRAGAAARSHTRTVEPPPQYELWLATAAPFRWLRLVEEQLNYDYLGKRKHTSATINFRLLLADVLRLAPGAAVSTSTESFVRKDKPGEHNFASEDDFARYNTRQLIQVLESRGLLG